MAKFIRLLFFCTLLLLSISASAQDQPDTFFLRKGFDIQTYRGDTTIVSRYNQAWRLKNIDIYIKDKVQYSDDYFYADTEYTVNRFYYNSTPKNKSIYKVFLTNGSLKLECEMIKSKINGYFKTYYRNGSKMCDCHYKDGKRDSLNRVYYPNGNINSIGYYKNGNPIDTLKIYHENGTLWSELIYRNGLLWNVLCNYSKNGEPMDKGTLKDGTGTLLIFDESGKLEETEYYVKGKLKKTIKSG